MTDQIDLEIGTQRLVHVAFDDRVLDTADRRVGEMQLTRRGEFGACGRQKLERLIAA